MREVLSAIPSVPDKGFETVLLILSAIASVSLLFAVVMKVLLGENVLTLAQIAVGLPYLAATLGGWFWLRKRRQKVISLRNRLHEGARNG